MRRVAPALAALVLIACGTPSPDLFEVTRKGRDTNANVRLLVSDGGFVTCNESDQKALDGPRLLEARDISRALNEQATLAVDLPPGENPTLSYEVRTEAGRVSLSDRSEGRPQAYDRLIAFTADVAENVCGLER